MSSIAPICIHVNWSQIIPFTFLNNKKCNEEIFRGENSEEIHSWINALSQVSA